MKLAEKTRESYQRAFAKYGYSPKSALWRNQKAANARYQALIDENISFQDKTILDVGCGFGDILPFIKARTKNFNYLGVDLVPEFVETAKKQHKTASFEVGDYYGSPLPKNFDIVLTSGTLNGNINDPLAYRFKAIETLWEHTNEVLAFNMAGHSTPPKNKKSGRIYFADALEVLKFCLKLTPKILFKQHYSLKNNDFTIIMFK